jgi:hypothetical protein
MDGLAKNSSRCRKKSRCGAQGWHLPLQAFVTAMTAAAAAAAEAEVQQAEEAAAANMALWQHSFSMQRARR